jgi:hypothetical protein
MRTLEWGHTLRAAGAADRGAGIVAAALVAAARVQGG